MRGYTSLLSHILGSHREICGYSETGQSYYGIYDLIMLRNKVCLANNNQLEGTFVLDKILHNGCLISDQIINRDDVYVIFMLRKPEETIKSIINMCNNADKTSHDINKYTEDYYLNRLEHLALCASRIDKKCIFIEAERVVEDTNTTLRFLEKQLKLKEKLKENYSTFSDTGKPCKGDTTSYIKTGKIIQQRNKFDKIIVPEQLLENACRAYNDCKEVLQKRCISF